MIEHEKITAAHHATVATDAFPKESKVTVVEEGTDKIPTPEDDTDIDDPAVEDNKLLKVVDSTNSQADKADGYEDEQDGSAI